MSDNPYKIKLGVDVDVSDIQGQINDKTKNMSVPIKVEIENIGDIKKQIQSLSVLKGGIEIPLSIDTNATIRSAQQIGQKIGTSVTKSVKQSINIDDVIDKQVADLMSKYAIAGKKGSKAFEEIRRAIVNYRKELATVDDAKINPDDVFGSFSNTSGVRQVTTALTNHIKIANEAKESYKELYEFIKLFNNSGAKVHLPDTIKQEYGDDFSSMRSSLGKAFTTGQGQDFESFVVELNSLLGNTIDLSHGAEAAFRDLYDKLSVAKEKKFLSGDELFGQGYLKFDDVEKDIASAVNTITAEENKLAQQSVKITNIIVQNEKKKQESYKATADAIDNLSNEKATNTGLEKVESDVKQAISIIDGAEPVIDNLKKSLNELGVNSTGIDAVTKDIQEMGMEIQRVKTEINGNNLKLSITGIKEAEDGIKRVVAETKEFADVVSNPESIKRSVTDSFETSADKTKESFEKLQSIANKISNLRIDIFKSDDTADISRASAELDKLNNEYNELFTKTKGSLSNKQLTQLDNISSKSLREFNSELNEFVKLQNQIENKRFEIGKLEVVGDKNNEIAELKRQLEELEDTYNRLMQTFMKKVSANSDILPLDSVKSLENGIENATRNAENRLERFKSQYADTRAELSKSIKLDIELGNFDDQMDVMRTKFNGLSDANDTLRRSVETVEDAYQRMLNASKADTGDEVADRERLIRAEKEYAAALEQTNNLIRQQARKDGIDEANRRLADSHKSLELDMVNWLKKNSKAVDEYGDQIDALIVSLNKLKQAGNLKQIDVNSGRRQFNNLIKDAESRGLTGLTAWDKLVSKAKEYSVYFSAAEAFMYAEQALRSMFEQVKLIDSAMTELKKVTDESDASYNRFLSNAGSRAKELGTTIDGLVSSTADFAKLGYGFKESQELAEIANIYAVVGDEIEGVEGATESLVSTLAAFKSEMNGMSDSDFAMSIVDKFNEVANKYSISSGGLGEALKRSASSMAAGNNSLDQTVALITAAM